MIGYRRKFVFVHIPKVAGQSVTKALYPYALAPHERGLQRIARLVGRRSKYDLYKIMAGHQTVAEYQSVLGPAQYDAFFSFTFVRNPWDRILSLYAFEKTRPAGKRHKIAVTGTLDDYLRWLSDRGLRSQAHFLRDGTGALNVDFIGRFETLAEDFQNIARRIGATRTLPHRNASRHLPYREVYSDWGRDAVAEIAADDIREFGYSF